MFTICTNRSTYTWFLPAKLKLCQPFGFYITTERQTTPTVIGNWKINEKKMMYKYTTKSEKSENKNVGFIIFIALSSKKSQMSDG